MSSRPRGYSDIPISHHTLQQQQYNAMHAARVPPNSPQAEFYVLKGDHFQKIGDRDMVNHLKRTSYKMATRTMTREVSFNDTLESSFFRQGTPVPGVENSSQKLNSWDQSPVADASPKPHNKSIPRRFNFGCQERLELMNTLNLTEDESTVHAEESKEESLNVTADTSFKSADMSWGRMRQEPDWLPSSQREPSSSSSRKSTSRFQLPSSNPGGVLIHDLPLHQLSLRNRFYLKMIAVLAPDLIVLESPVDVDANDTIVKRRFRNIDSFCQNNELPAPLSCKNHEVVMVKNDGDQNAWSFGVCVGQSINSPKEEWARIAVLEVGKAGKFFVVTHDECSPVPTDLLVDLPFVIVKLNGIRIKPKKSEEAMKFIGQHMGMFVSVVTRNHHGRLNEVDMNFPSHSKAPAVNVNTALINKGLADPLGA